MLQLFVENEVVANPTMKLRWCVNAETINWLRDNKISHPKILIVTYSEKTRRENRYITDLLDLMLYIPFHAPGKNRIFATIVWDGDGKNSSAKDIFLRKEHGDYYETLINSEGEMFESHYRTHERAEVAVVVDDQLFPKQPADWDWVNEWFKSSPVDECAFRKRRILAYSVQPIAMLLLLCIGFTAVSLASLASIVGMACIGRLPGNWNRLNPIEIEDFSPKEAYKSDRYTPKRSFFKKWYLLPLRPVFVIAFAVVGIINGISTNATYFWDTVLLGVEAFAYVAVAYYLISIIFVKPIERRREALGTWFGKVSAEYEAYQKAREDRLRKRELQEMLILACTSVNKANPMEIPKQAKSARLRFDGIKRKVCRPFAQ